MDFFSRNVETGIQHVCESVFVRLCQIVGTSVQVAIRRQTRDVMEMVERRVKDGDCVITTESGSRREGFRLKGSDLDYMVWMNKDRVIWDMIQSEHYYTDTKNLILSDSSKSPPGFTLLEVLTPSSYNDYKSECVRINDRYYISSSVLRRHVCLSHQFLGLTEHGPCQTAVNQIRREEYDFAFCFACDFWPPSVSPWIERCHSWPDKEVVNNIVRNGCHFVPIGNPIGIHGLENEEWRISFSLAEHKLVHAMNHCQFLTYGLLKIFLKEVIDKQSGETNKLLCSYHMKTAAFWVIQQNTIPCWCPQNLLLGFWVCFKLLLKWVYEGVCPNFFIPQNNLFLSKVYGSAQRSLFLQLHGLYEKGLTCLLQSSSFRSCITDVLYNPRLSICTDEDRIKSEAEYDFDIFSEINRNDSLFSYNQHHRLKFLRIINQLLEFPLTDCQVLMLQRLTASLLQSTLFTLHNMHTHTGHNKQTYIADKMSCHILKLAANLGCISDMAYIAMYYYKTSRHWKALSVIETSKVRLAQPCSRYGEQVDPRIYTDAVRGQSWSYKMKQAVSDIIKISKFICYIKELRPEHQCALENNVLELRIPLFVGLLFVEFLCYRHINTALAQGSLDELQELLYDDQGLYVDAEYRDISWQILGICQQITGNLQAALYSYQQSLQQFPFHKIQTATHMRINDLHIT